MAKVAVLLADGFDDSQFRLPYDRLQEAGHDVLILGHERGECVRDRRGLDETWIEGAVSSYTADDFDALVIPGGYAPDQLRGDDDVLEFVRGFFACDDKVVAAVSHGPQLLISARVVAGRHVTSWPSVRVDLENAGATWVDRPVVVDRSLITSRQPADLDAFCDAILAKLGGTSPTHFPHLTHHATPG